MSCQCGCGRLLHLASDTDLLGDPVPATPAMGAQLPWRVFRMSDISDDTEWVMARTEREAVAFYVEFCNEMGDCRTEAELREEGSIHKVHELTDAELAAEAYTDPLGLPAETFAIQLAQMAAHAKVPMFFASTEY